jgi:hypothetical protein
VEPDIHPSGRPQHSEHVCQIPAHYWDEIPLVAELTPELEQGEPANNGQATGIVEPGILDPISVGMDVNGDPSSNISGTSFYDTDIDSFNMPQKMKKWWSGITKSSSMSMILEPEQADEAWWQNIITNVNDSYFQPFKNPSSYLLMKWFYSGSNAKTLVELDWLVQEVLLKPDFDHAELVNFHTKRESQCIDVIKDKSLANSLFQAADRWYKINISLPVPFECIKHSSISQVPIFTMESLIYQHPLQVLLAALQDASPDEFHLQPFKLYWQHNGDPDDSEHLYSKLYNSDVLIEEHEHIRKAYETQEHETVVAAMMFWSDLMHLANFGNASLYPIYLYLGNQTKYMQCKPSAVAAHHIAYIPKVWSTIIICSSMTDLTWLAVIQ